jgi:hypothetical protein
MTNYLPAKNIHPGGHAWMEVEMRNGSYFAIVQILKIGLNPVSRTPTGLVEVIPLSSDNSTFFVRETELFDRFEE